jgi:hypothetical protein
MRKQLKCLIGLEFSIQRIINLAKKMSRNESKIMAIEHAIFGFFQNDIRIILFHQIEWNDFIFDLKCYD